MIPLVNKRASSTRLSSSSTTQEVPQCLHHSYKGARTIEPPFVGVLSLSHALGSSPRVPRPHQPTHDHIISFKGLRTIKPSSVGPRTSSNTYSPCKRNLNQTRGPPSVKIHHATICGVSKTSPRVPCVKIR